MSLVKLFGIFVCLSSVRVQTSTPQDDSYIAAVLEYNFTRNTTANLYNYLQFVKEAADQNADILVFPEMTLNQGQVDAVQVPFYGLLKTYPTPALHPEFYDEILVTLSDAAKQNHIYMVVNLIEHLDCTKQDSGELCPEEKVYQFNTNVVFDRNGTVIDRYRKINLFGEFSRTPSLKSDLGVFSTDFGVTFGHFICFDLMFQVPAVQIVQKLNLTDVIFPTMWFSEMPYLTAVQIQEAYAYSMNVNFLTSGANNVGVGSAGSGIYSGKAGALVSIMPGVPTTKLLVARVPKVPGQKVGTSPGPIYNRAEDHDGLKMKVDPSMESHVSQLLRDGQQHVKLTDHDVICTMSVKLTQREGNNKYRYRAVSLDGVRSFSGFATGGKQACAVLACTGDMLDTCGSRFPLYHNDSSSLFEELKIIANFPAPVYNESIKADNSAYYAVSLTSQMMPLEPEAYTLKRDIVDKRVVYEISLKKPKNELYSFGIWGRVFLTDGMEPTPPLPTESLTNAPGASSKNFVNFILLLAVFVNMF